MSSACVCHIDPKTCFLCKTGMIMERFKDDKGVGISLYTRSEGTEVKLYFNDENDVADMFVLFGDCLRKVDVEIEEYSCNESELVKYEKTVLSKVVNKDEFKF